jgi:uncharacterized membrane protein YqjE
MSPAIFVAIILRLTQQLSNSAFAILICLDVIGAIGGVWWMYQSDKITKTIFTRMDSPMSMQIDIDKNKTGDFDENRLH